MRQSTRGSAQRFDQTEVVEQRFAHGVLCRIAGIEQDIRWFDIAVNQAVLMRVVDGEADGGEETNEIGSR